MLEMSDNESQLIMAVQRGIPVAERPFAELGEACGMPEDDVIEFIKNMSVLELSELISEFEEIFGVSAAAPVAMAVAGPTADAPAAEQTEFDAMMLSFGDKKIQVIKVVRAITGLGLKEAKSLVEEAPVAVKEGVTKEEAEDIKAQIEEAGGSVDIK
jgi:large subunit ribosomal protein L7/L12